jgi:Reverse transcriptase (RNA-dependent DNA polymerase)
MSDFKNRMRCLGCESYRTWSEDSCALVATMEAWNDERVTVQAKLLDERKRMKGAAGPGEEILFNGTVQKFKKRNAAGPGEEAFFADERCHSNRVCHRELECKAPVKDLRNVNRKLCVQDERNKAESANVARLGRRYTACLSRDDRDDFIIDSGATAHMCFDKSRFSELKLGNFGNITVANGQVVQSKGKGKVTFVVDDGRTQVPVEMSDTLWVPDLDSNLVSVHKLVSKGFSIHFSDGECSLMAKGDKVVIAKYVGGMYRVCEKLSCHNAKTKAQEYCVHEWHRRMAHRNLRVIRLMEKQGLKILECDCSDDCESCMKGKHSRKPFPKSATPVENVLDCVTSDVCGPIQVESLGRKKYFVTFNDVYSGFTEVQLMRCKSEVPEKAIEFIEKMKTQVGKKPKILRSDRAKEYTCEKLQSYLKKEGILFQCTVGYAPEQNGVAERKNRTLMEATRSMIANSGLPKTLWAEAVSTAAYVYNHTINVSRGKTPIEILFGRKSKHEMFYEFGCEAFVMVPYEKRKKLDEKSRKMRFVGYDGNSKGYRFVDECLSIVVSREAQFLSKRTKHVDGERYLNVDFDATSNDDHQEADDFFDAADIFEESVVSISDDDEENQDETVIKEDNELLDNDSQVTDRDAEINVEEENISDQSVSDVDGTFLELEVAGRREVNFPDGNVVIRSSRSNFGRPPPAFASEAKAGFEEEPKTYKQAVKSTQAAEWKKAMNEELKSIKENQTWELTDLPPGRTAVGSKWVFRIKRDESGKISLFKARVVAQGFSQKYGVDYVEVFAPVVRNSTVRMLLSVAGVKKFTVRQYDVKTAFLNGSLEEEIYMKPPQGFETNGKVLRLKKSLYGLKQAAYVWNQTLHEALEDCGFVQNETDKCLYVYLKGEDICYLLFHVDDILVASSNAGLISKLMARVGAKFELKDIGCIKSYLGVEVDRDENGHFMISQTKYINAIIEAAGLKDAKDSKFPMDTGYYKLDGKFLSDNELYRKLVGMLLYLATNTRPDISASVSILSQRVTKPRDVDMNEVKRVVRYLRGTRNLKLHLSTQGSTKSLFAYSDANWAEDRTDRKSNSGYICMVNGGAVSWCCRKQDLVALSSTEAEYVALSETCKEVMYLKRIASAFGNVDEKTCVYTDSQSSMSMVYNQRFSNRTKHIETKYHFARGQVQKGNIYLQYKQTDLNVADMLTKPLGSIKISALRGMASLR